MRLLALYVVLLFYGAVNISCATRKRCSPTHAADIVFVLDSSFSIRHLDYHRQLSFLRALIDSFNMGDNHVQVGVVSFGSTVRLDIKLNEFTNKRDLKQVVSGIRQMEGGTNTYDAIHFVRTMMFDPANGGRSLARKQLILITDGLSSNSSSTLLEASIARVSGIEIFSILVGEHLEDLETRGVASEPKDLHIFRVESYKALAGIEHALSRATCKRNVRESTGQSDAREDEDGDESELPPRAVKACERNLADVIFLMDSSSSIWEPDFRRQVKFVEQVTARFDLGEDAIRVGVVVYSDAPITLVDLSDEQSHQHIHEALTKVPHITGGTNTALAINHARKTLSANRAARSNSAQVIIILSDGQSNDLEQTISETSRAHEDGVKTFLVGFGENFISEELIGLATDPDHKFDLHVSDQRKLSEVAELLALKTCSATTGTAQQDTCPRIPTDVLFIYDSSSLHRRHYNYVINIISEVTRTKRLNSEALHVGVIRNYTGKYSLALPDIELTNQWNHSNFKNRLDADARTANVDILFRKARHLYFHSSIRFDTVPQKRMVVLFLDTHLENQRGATVEAIRLRKSHVNVVVVVVGKLVDISEVRALASMPYNHNIIRSVHVQRYKVRVVVSKLMSVLCE